MRERWTNGIRLIRYDAEKRRLWVLGQRVHHGTTGIVLAVAHDWKDRPVWFQRGAQQQP